MTDPLADAFDPYPSQFDLVGAAAVLHDERCRIGVPLLCSALHACPVCDPQSDEYDGRAGGKAPAADSRCDPTKPSDLSPVPHDYEDAGEEHGSVGDGGSYYRLKCRRCGRVAYSPMGD